MIRTIKQIKLKSGDYGKWDYGSLLNLPDIGKISSDKIDALKVEFDSESSSLTLTNPGGSLETSVDLSGLVRSGNLEKVELVGTDAVGTRGMYLKFTWVTGNNTNITYANLSDMYREGAGIIMTEAVDGVGRTISVDAAYIEELIVSKTTETIESYVSNAIDEARQRWLEL